MTRVLLVTAMVVLAAGCGGVENDPNLARAAERTEAAGTGRFEVESGGGKWGRLVCMGSADYQRRRAHARCDFDAVGTYEMIAIGRDYYYRGELLAGLGAGKWVKESADREDDSSLVDLSPQTLLTMLRSASNQTERVGEEDVRGEATVRYRLVVDCERANLSCRDSASVEVWIGDDGIVRRLAVEDDQDKGTFEFFDFGAVVDIEPPPAEQVVDASNLAASGGSSTSEDVACAQGQAVPISQATLVATLRTHGVNVQDDPHSCIVSNADGDTRAVLEREGIVHCSIHAQPPAGAPTTVTRRGADGADAELALRNVECTIFTDSSAGEEKIDKLEAAFAELERIARP